MDLGCFCNYISVGFGERNKFDLNYKMIVRYVEVILMDIVWVLSDMDWFNLLCYVYLYNIIFDIFLWFCLV